MQVRSFLKHFNLTKKENKKDKILKTAVKLFAQKGFNGTSIREICKDASVSLCMISYYWGGKKELYKGIIADLFERQTEFAKSFFDLEKEPILMTREEQISTLKLFAN